jgi:signal peptidase II
MIIIADQITKQIFWRSFTVGQSVDVIDGLFRITLVRNPGAAFGVFQGGRVVFVVASVVAIVFIILVARKLSPAERYKRFLLGLILGGAIGNLIDRVYAGEVIDFLEIGIKNHWWPVFNVADMGVSIGAALLLILIIAKRHEPEPVEAPETRCPSDPTSP